ncbi:MAG: AMP-binding protein, partial [Pseudomonadota bacterium]
MLDGFVPWPEAFVKKYKEAGYWEDLTMGDVFNRFVGRYGPRVALVYGDQKISYEQLGQRAVKMAYQMIKSGFKTYDRLVMNLPNIPELPYVYYGSLLIGVIPIMSLVAHRWAEISHFAQTADASAHAIPAQFGKFDFQALAQDVRTQVPGVKITLVAGRPRYPDMISIDDLLAEEIDHNEAQNLIQKYRPNPMEPAVLQLSGGTTGVPKLIPRTHNDYHYNSKQNARVCGVNEDTVLLVQPPLAHNFARSCPGMTGVLMNGGRVVLTTDVSPEEAFRLIEKEKVTNLPIV